MPFFLFIAVIVDTSGYGDDGFFQVLMTTIQALLLGATEYTVVLDILIALAQAYSIVNMCLQDPPMTDARNIKLVRYPILELKEMFR